MTDGVDPVETLARTVWGEARGEGRTGMVAVASVIKNRADHPRWWGHNIVSVCTDPYQFSCRNRTDPNYPKLLSVTASDPQYAEALDIAAGVIAGTTPDAVQGATRYYDSRMPIPPSWAVGHTPLCQIGHHLFFGDLA